MKGQEVERRIDDWIEARVGRRRWTSNREGGGEEDTTAIRIEPTRLFVYESNEKWLRDGSDPTWTQFYLLFVSEGPSGDQSEKPRESYRRWESENKLFFF